MNVLAIDPGPTASAFVLFDGDRVLDQGHLDNEALLERLIAREFGPAGYVTAIEQIESMGMAVGRETFETVFWSGRFAQATCRPFDRVTRRDVKLHLCGTMRAKDQHVRQALLDKFGGRRAAMGRKASPGPLHGVGSHRWAAVAVAVTWWETKR